MDAVRLPVGRLAAAMLAGQRRGATAGGGDDGIVPGRTIIVTSTTDSVVLKINGVSKTYAVTPNEPTRVVVEEGEVTMLDSFFENQKVTELDLSNFDTSNVASYSRLFFQCSNLKSIKGLKVTSKTISLSDTFYQCNRLEEVEDMSKWDTSNIGSFWRTFYGCGNLKKDFSSFDISHKAVNVTNMFNNGGAGSSLDISTFDFNRVPSTDSMFGRCGKLTDLRFGRNLKVSVDFSSCPLTHESALSVIEGLAEVDTAQTVTFKATTYGTLTEGEIALATSRGWSVVSA